ncbi:MULTISPECIES: FHA domain-containing protein [unclassified Methanoregula]|uniref:FHA domain-containing protein n=1 Tax=unclassified Methanoregula TaxID=2649730 RepID=UPI0009CF5913|nr:MULTISPECIES: FHA domain-containing protein [unclassified Methanoregula]OPX61568.1 MAG: FHA domain protein [Methanoregula sp. PtaB.Bin085]OPY36768.1 MAG: FHA domain protein [Methanoregula sp. PtaU1.Bin006]
MEDHSGRTVVSPDSHDDRFRTIECLGDPDPLAELSEYLDVLSNSTRLKIVKCLEKKPRTTREISQEVETSYENTKKHLDRLCLIGVIRKEAGITDPRQKGVQLFWKYSLVPGGLESVIRNLGLFSHMKMHIVREDISEKIDTTKRLLSRELFGSGPVLIVLGGPDDGKIFPLKNEAVRIGRIDPQQQHLIDPLAHLVLAQGYSSVSRVTKPHAMLARQNELWTIGDGGSRGGTAVNKKVLGKTDRVPLRDGDLIELSRGPAGAKLLVVIPQGS